MFRSSVRKDKNINRVTVSVDTDIGKKGTTRGNKEKPFIAEKAELEKLYETSTFTLEPSGEEDDSFLSPSVQVKHSVTYEYDMKKFELIKGEYLFLINKTNQDWWLCLRLDENLTFFVPASYVDEFVTPPVANFVAPPKAPPPPPDTFERKNRASLRSNAAVAAAAVAAVAASTTSACSFSEFANGTDSQRVKKPEVKQRQLLNYSAALTTLASSSESPSMTLLNRNSSTYSLITNNPDNNNTKSFNYENECAAEAIINDLDECLNKEEESFTNRSKLGLENSEEDLHIYQNLPQSGASKETKKSTDDLEEKEEFTESETDSEAGLDEDLQKVPRGWKIAHTDYNKKYFYNNFNDEKWYINVAYGKHYFYNDSGRSVWELDELPVEEESKHFINAYDGDLGTFNNIHKRLSHRISTDGEEIKQTRPKKIGTSNYFKCVKLIERGKKSKKKAFENYRVELASTNLLFIKELKGLERLDFPIDLKGGKCLKIDNPKSLLNQANKDNNNNSQSSGLKVASKPSNKSLTKKDKSLEELEELIGSCKSGFVVETVSLYKILLVNDNEQTINEWVSIINAILVQHPVLNSPVSQTSDQLGQTDEQKLTDQRTRSYLRKDEVVECDDVVEADGLTMVRKLSDSDKSSYFKNMRTFLGLQNNRKSIKPVRFENQKSIPHEVVILPPLPKRPPPDDVINTLMVRNNLIKSFLTTFLKRRPPYEQLKSEGIIKECVYGSNLISLCQRENRSYPLFVEVIIEEIEAKGLDIDGIYRISGNLAEVQKVRHQVDHGKHNFKDFDIHVLCGALKTFFRELEEPLIPFDLHEEFLSSIVIMDKSKRFESIAKLVQCMPVPHRDTLRHLCRHLKKVVEQSGENRMNVQNVALVFGPNIMRSNPINNANNGFNPHIMTQNIIVEYILTNYRELFHSSPT